MDTNQLPPGYGENVGHGHVWERPDGQKVRCGGPPLCNECAKLQAMVDRYVDKTPAVVALPMRENLQEKLQWLEKENERLRAANERYASALEDKAHLLLAPKALFDGVQEIAEAIGVLQAVEHRMPYNDRWQRLVERIQASIASLLLLQQRLKLSTDVNKKGSGGQPSD